MAGYKKCLKFVAKYFLHPAINRRVSAAHRRKHQENALA